MLPSDSISLIQIIFNKAWYSEELCALKTAGEQKRQEGHKEQVLPHRKPDQSA